MSLGMNMCLCIDLVLTLRSPFYPAKRRLKFYLLFSFVLAIIMMAISIPRADDTCRASANAAKSERQNGALAVVLSLYVLISLFSIVYAARMLSRPGISGEIRKIFMKKHVLYSISFIIIWSLNLLNAYDALYNRVHQGTDAYNALIAQGKVIKHIRLPVGTYIQVIGDEDKKYMDLTTLQLISFIASLSTGLVMGIIRCFEPYFLFLLKKTIKAVYGVPLTEEEIAKKNSKMTDTISAFLNSSLNIELVHIILKAITQECTKTELPKDGWKSYIPLDANFEERRKYDLNEIVITDPKKWGLFNEPADDLAKSLNAGVLNDQSQESLIINEDISIEELAPDIFAMIRNQEHITTENIIESLSPEFNRDMVFKAGEGQGKSGSFFFFSHDRRFIIKTMNNEEYRTFQNIFKNYYHHLIKHKDSIIARIFGIFTVNKEKLQPVHLILMDNTVTLQGKKLVYMFDLKGSFANRETKVGKKHNPSNTLKDINLLNVKMQKNIMKFSKADSESIMEVIKRDVPILKNGNIMDYSLLLAIEENPNYRSHAVTVRKMSKSSSNNRSNSMRSGDDSVLTINEDNSLLPHHKFKASRHMFLSSNLQYIYHISIIDYLQDYNLDKKGENFIKIILKGRKAEISAVPSVYYAKRYIDFMENEVILSDKKFSSSSGGVEELSKIKEEEDKKEDSKSFDW